MSESTQDEKLFRHNAIIEQGDHFTQSFLVNLLLLLRFCKLNEFLNK